MLRLDPAEETGPHLLPVHCGFAANAGSVQSQSCLYLFVFAAIPQTHSCCLFVLAVARNHALRPYRKLLRAVCSFLRLPAIVRCGIPQTHSCRLFRCAVARNYLLLRVCRNLSRAVESCVLPQSCGWPQPAMRCVRKFVLALSCGWPQTLAYPYLRMRAIEQRVLTGQQNTLDRRPNNW